MSGVENMRRQFNYQFIVGRNTRCDDLRRSQPERRNQFIHVGWRENSCP